MNRDTINQRIVKTMNYLLNQKIVHKKGDIAEILQCSPQTITEILGGRQGMKIDILQKFFDRFNVSYEYIFEGKGDFLKKRNSSAQESAQKSAQESTVFSSESCNSKSTTFEKEGSPTSIFLPASGKSTSTKIIKVPVPVENDSDTVNIPVVDISVAAGSGFYNPDFISEIDKIRFPRSMVKRNHTYLCVRIKGESMVPTLQDGGYLIIRLLDRSEWQYIRDEHVYVVASNEGNAFVKRLKNRFKDHGFIVCMSDNPDPMGFPNFNLFENEINTIWYAEWYISAKMPNIHKVYYNKVSELEDAFNEIKESFQTFSNLPLEVKQLRQEIVALKGRN